MHGRSSLPSNMRFSSLPAEKYIDLIREECCATEFLNAMVQYGNELVSLQQQEAQLITKNNELKIEVEQLKGPERIIGLAEQYLGMSVARSNIYVKAGGSSNSLAVHNK